jgi:hypothetical protein
MTDEQTSNETRENIIDAYRNLQQVDILSAQNRFVRHLTRSADYGMIHFEVKVRQ